MSNNAHIVILTTGLRGRLNSTLALANRLRDARYRITFASPWNCAEQVSIYSFDYVQLPQTTLDTTQFTTKEQALAALGVDDLPEILNKLQPLLLLIDFELSAHIIAVQNIGIPIALISSWFDVSRSEGIPPLSSPIVPGRGWRGSTIGMSLAWTKFIARRRWHYTSKRIRWRGRDHRSILLTLAKKNNIEISTRTRTFDSFGPPFVWHDIPTLSMNAAELDFPHRKPPNLTYLGPMVHQDRENVLQNHPAQSQLEDLIQNAREREIRIVYCAASTMPADLDLRSLIQKVSQQLENFYFVVSSPLVKNHIKQERVLYLHSAPQMHLLQHVDLVINHGGINTINECLYFGVPMVIISGGKFDQHGSAARIAYHGLGKVFFSAPSAEDLAISITETLNSEDVKRQIVKYQSSLSKYTRDSTLLKVISRLTEG